CWIEVFVSSMSWGLEVKLDPEERDSHTCCGKAMHFPRRPSARLRLIPNSAKALTGSAVLFSPLSSAAMVDWFASPSNAEPSGMMILAPQQGMAFATRHVPLFPPSVDSS